MWYYIGFGLIFSILLFGFKRTVFFAIFLALLSVVGAAFITILPIVVGLFIFYRIIGKSRYRGKDSDQSEKFERVFKFYYYNTGENGYNGDSGQNYRNTFNSFDSKKHYSTLGLDENASGDEVKTAYKKLAKQYHPDLHEGKSIEEKKSYENKFKEINAAYEEIKKRQSGDFTA